MEEPWGSDDLPRPRLDQPGRPRIEPLGIEEGMKRFHPRRDIARPPVAAWRCNLTALSQRRNLLFVAHGYDIYVWKPKGPFQLLGSQPEMIIHPTMRDPDRRGYIDPLRPHGINNIHVGDLGRDEVLVLATDSGNVCAYHVEAIFSAVTQSAENGQKRPFDGAEVTPFLAENVGRSAWGLATHKFARLIAVGSNAGEITVFAFALVDPQSEDTNDDDFFKKLKSDDSGQGWVLIESRTTMRELKKLMPYRHRSRNLRLVYHGHFTNIPSVSFADFDLDANGLWMVSTDIENKVFMWRVWDDLWPVHQFYPAHPEVEGPETSWFVLPLDPRTFQRHQEVIDACACLPTPWTYETVSPHLIWDISMGIGSVPDTSQTLNLTSRPRPTPGVAPVDLLPDDLLSSDCFIDSGVRPGSASSSQNEHSPSRPLDQVSVNEDIEHSRVEVDLPSSEIRAEPENDESSSIRVEFVNQPISSLFEEDNEHLTVPSWMSPSLFSEAVHNETEFEEPVPTLEYISLPQHALRPSCFPIMHFSQHHITLTPYPIDCNYHILHKFTLSQFPAFSFPVNSECDRINMVKYIPELGLVIAASQRGRVGIITLTWQERIGYAFRVDWLVPFKTQESKGQRPMVPLIGMAASPMPGFEIPPDVPSIPYGVDPNDWLKFKYCILNPDEHEHEDSNSSSPSPPPSTPPPHLSSANPTASSAPAASSEGEEKKSEHPSENGPKFTIPETHAEASRIYRPHEPWHGWHPSRHYRLLLHYCDCTVMSYEFWHEWRS